MADVFREQDLKVAVWLLLTRIMKNKSVKRLLENISKRSQARILSSLKSFCTWLVIEGVIKDNPCDKVDAPKLGRYLPDVLSVEEVQRMMDARAGSVPR